MQNRIWIVVDVSALAYRGIHTMGDLSYQGVGTGAVYSVLRTTMDMMDRYGTRFVAFCFDGGRSARLKHNPEYKANRYAKDEPEDVRKARIEVRSQLDRLQTQYLPQIGFRNVFHQVGYEADDLIASVCKNRLRDTEFVVVTEDADLLQLLEEDRVSVWNPGQKRLRTEATFRRDKGISPRDWAKVKAIAGCPSDNVVGVVGVGEKRAIDFINKTLKTNTVSYKHIQAAWNDGVIPNNYRLVRLPFPGTMDCQLVEDEFTQAKWNRVMDSLGIKTIRGKVLQ